MNQIFAGSAALVLALMLWTFGKQPLKSLRAKNQINFSVTTRSEHPTLVKEKLPNQTKEPFPSLSDRDLYWQKPKTIQQRLELQSYLKKSISSGPKERLEAVTLAGLWGHSSVLPILRRGLKDSDSRVIHAAAKAFQKHRGINSLKESQETTARPPRNVALMR